MPEPEIVGARTGSAREADVGGICRRVLVVPTTPLEAGSGEGVTVMVIAKRLPPKDCVLLVPV